MDETKVILIGGTSGAGKTTLGRELAERLGASSLSIDDLHTAAKAVTTPETHPGLHVMSTGNHVNYFTTSTVEQLTADATTQHEATWPVIDKVIRKHAAWGDPIVIDGWALRPEKVKRLNLTNVASFWLVIDAEVLEARERRNVEFTQDSPDPERMLQNFLGRSLWYNEFTREQATALGLPLLYQDGTATVDDLCDEVLRRIGHSDGRQRAGLSHGDASTG